MGADAAERRRRQSWYGLKRPVKQVMSLPGVNLLAHAVTASTRGSDTAARLPAPMGIRRVEGHIDDITYVMNDPAQCIIAKELYWGRGVRPRAQDQFALEAFARLAQHADHVLDIGSYTGVFSVVAAKVNRAVGVEAFEIVPSNFLAAWANVIANDLVGRIEVRLEGVGDEGSVRMPAATVGSALPDFWSIDDATDDAGIRVPISTLETVIARTAGRLGYDRARLLIKVDVEGHEKDLVTASRDVIRTDRPTFLMEILPGADVAPLLDVFGGLSEPYRYYLVTDDRLREQATLHGDDTYRDWLITTLVPEELTALGIATDELV